MTSDPFVWTWLGGRRTPVVAGRVVPLDEGSYGFVYGKSYLATRTRSSGNHATTQPA